MCFVFLQDWTISLSGLLCFLKEAWQDESFEFLWVSLSEWFVSHLSEVSLSKSDNEKLLFLCQIVGLFLIPTTIDCCLVVFNKRSWHVWVLCEHMINVWMYVMGCIYNCVSYYTCFSMIDKASDSEWEQIVLCWVHDELQ